MKTNLTLATLLVVCLFISITSADESKSQKNENQNSPSKSSKSKEDSTTITLTDDLFKNIHKEKDLLIFFRNTPQGRNATATSEDIFNRVVKQIGSLYPTLDIAFLDSEKYNKLYTELDRGNNSMIKLVRADNYPGESFFGDYTVENIVKWVHKFYLSPLVSVMNSPNDVDQMLKYNPVIVFFGGKKNNPQFDVFKKVSSRNYNINFALCSNLDCINHYNAEVNSVILFKGLGEKPVELSKGFIQVTLEKFIEENSLPDISNLSYSLYKLGESKGISTVIIFKSFDDYTEDRKQIEVKKLKDEFKSGMFKILEERKKAKKPQIHFLMTNIINDDLNIQNILRLHDNDMPTVVIFDHKEKRDEILKFKFINEQEELSLYDVEKFLREWDEGKLEPYFYSEPTDDEESIEFALEKIDVNELIKNEDSTNEEDKEHPKEVKEEEKFVTEPLVTQITGKNFKRKVVESTRDVLIFVFNPNLKETDSHLTQIENTSKKMLSHKESIFFAKIDGTKNEFSKKILNWNNSMNFILYKSKQKPDLINLEVSSISEDKLGKFIEENNSFNFKHKHDEL